MDYYAALKIAQLRQQEMLRNSLQRTRQVEQVQPTPVENSEHRQHTVHNLLRMVLRLTIANRSV